jgi:uncharacterized low-complexity protein
MNKFSRKPLAVALGAAFALSGIAVAQASVFQTADLGSGYMVAAAEATMPAPADATPAAPAPAKHHRHHRHHKSPKMAGEAKCGEKGSNCEKGAKAGECVCGASMGKKADGKCGAKGSNCEKGAKAGECMCGASMGKKADGKCGEGKCGNKK